MCEPGGRRTWKKGCGGEGWGITLEEWVAFLESVREQMAARFVAVERRLTARNERWTDGVLHLARRLDAVDRGRAGLAGPSAGAAGGLPPT